MLSPYHPPEEFKRVQEHSDSRIKESEDQERTIKTDIKTEKGCIALQRTEADGHGYGRREWQG